MRSPKAMSAVAVGALCAGALGVLAVDELFDDDYEYGYRTSVASVAAAPAPPTTGAPLTDPGTVPTDGADTADTAGGPVEPTVAGTDKQSAGPVDAARAAEIGADAVGGEAVDVWPGVEAGRSVYYVDVRTDDGMVEVYVDATTGEIMAIEPGS